MICCSLGYAEASVEATISQPEPMCEISLRPTMVCLFPQLKSSFTVYGVTLPSPLLAALGYAPPTLGTWPRFFFSLVSPPKVNLIPDRGVNSGHANNDAKPCIGTFEIKTPSRIKERLPISGSKAGRIPEREAKKAHHRHDGTYSTAAGTTDRRRGCARKHNQPQCSGGCSKLGLPAPASAQSGGNASVTNEAFLNSLVNNWQ